MNTQIHPSPTWRCFENINSGPEAASAAASCAFSLSTLEVASVPDSAFFAVTERKQPEIWRWAVIGDGNEILEQGFEPTRDGAKEAAAAALEAIKAQDGA
jgi:hypothetical protein